MKICFALCSFSLLLIPSFVDASVLISEVAWMGSLSDANAEWIELYNNGETQDVTGWTLLATDGQPSVTLSGSIGSNTYALLERSDDTTVSNVPAFTIYTGALGNTGEILELRDQNGALLDSVDGSDTWGIGGDNTTKETLQRSGEPAVGGWSTGAPTPKGGAVGNGDVQGEETARTSTAKGTVLIGAETDVEKKVYLEPSLTLDIGSERTVTVGVPVLFLARSFRGAGDEIIVTDIVWNFGDGTVEKGRDVAHSFAYTGDYLVSATGRRSGFLREITDTKQVVVHVVEPAVEIEHADSTYIELKNKSTTIIDISEYVLVSGSTHFRIPNATQLLANTSVRFPRKTTGLEAGQGVSLFYPDGSLVATYGFPKEAVVPSVVFSRTVPQTPPTQEGETKGVSDEVFSLFDEIQVPHVVPEFTKTVNAYTGAEQGQEKNTRLWWWLVGLATAIGTAVLAVILVRREQAEEIEGFYIESEEE